MNQSETQALSVWGKRMLSLTTLLLGISFAASLILGSYYDQPITQALSFRIQDNERFDSGLGIHSFGDFQEIRYALPTADYPDFWTNSNSAYTPSAFVPNVVAKRIQELFGVQISLMTYLLALAICTAAPAIWVARNQNRENIILSFLVLTVFAQPFITTFDRGNSVGFALPFIMMFAVGFFDQKSLPIIIGLIGAFAFRPQFALLGMAILTARMIKPAIITAVGCLTVFFGSFLFMPGAYSDSIAAWFQNLKNFTRKYDHGVPFPANLSSKTSFGGVFDFGSYTRNSILIVVVVLLVFLSFRTAHDKPRILIASLTLPCLIPALSFSYYSTFVLIIAGLILAYPKFFENGAQPQSKLILIYHYSLISAIAVSLAPIPFVREVGRNSIALESFSTIWTTVLFFTLVVQIFEHQRSRVAA